jgi:hypothetical protein
MIKDELEAAGIRVIPKTESRLMRAIGWFSEDFMKVWWTSYRVPFGPPTITYPSDTKDPYAFPQVLKHERIHCEQFRPWYAPLWMLLLETLIPLPIFWSGRWYVERKAYLRDILAGVCCVEEAVQTLWYSYGYVYPKPLMRRYFQKHVREGK